MRRRGNKSAKVPGVKLRPAEQGAMRRAYLAEDALAQDTQPGSDDTVAYRDLCPRPFKGVVICATGVPDKPTLFKNAVELGATCTPAFTDRVTHLIALEHGGAKYTCALERKIPILKPSWVLESYDIWLKGDDVDVSSSIEGHRLPIFSGVVLCPSGIADMHRRTQISKLITDHDGIYLNKLERPVRVTHLLCSTEEETEKMKYAQKFNMRGEAKIHLVWEEWFWDSLNFGGRFSEGAYDIRRPRPKPKVIPEEKAPPAVACSSLVGSQHDLAPSSSAVSLSRTVSRRLQPQGDQSNHNGDEQEEELAFANVLPAVTLQLWSGLLERRGCQIVDGEVILSPSKDSGTKSRYSSRRSPSSPQPRNEEDEDPALRKSVISAFRRANSFAPVVPIGARDGSAGERQMPFRRTATSTAVFGGGAEAGPSRIPATNVATANAATTTAVSPKPSNMFSGKVFRALGEAKSATVRGAVEDHGGKMAVDEDDDVDFIVVRLVSGSKIYQMEEDEHIKSKYRTECWLEQCIYEERICPVDEHVTFIPLAIDIPISGAEKINLCMSGFDASESFGLKRLLRALDITLAPLLTRRVTHLLCPSGVGPKFEKALEWNIPVVNMGWLRAIASLGRIPPVHRFLVEGPPEAAPCDMEMQHEIPLGVDDKGKGKATDRGNVRTVPVPSSENGDVEMQMEGPGEGGVDADMMNDITNTTPPAEPVPPDERPAKKVKPNIERQPTTLVIDTTDLRRAKNRTSIPQGDTLQTVTSTSSFVPHPSSICTPTRSRITQTPQYHYGHSDQFESEPLEFIPNPNSILQQGRTVALPQLGIQKEASRSSSWSEDVDHAQEQEQYQAGRIPSSKSPSPMKAPGSLRKRVPIGSGSSASGSRQSMSPVKIDLGVTKALQESITSLLGKRSSPDGEESAVLGGLGVGAGAGPAAAPAGRHGKRARPQKGKGPSRKASERSIESPVVLNPPVPIPAPRAGPAQEESQQMEQSISRSQLQESMRVTYEDPSQADEKMRLMNMLKGPTLESQESFGSASGSADPRRRARKSMRIAGF